MYDYKQVYGNREYYLYAKDILKNSEFKRRKYFLHHQDSVYEHSIRVSLVAFHISRFLSKFFPISTEDVVVSALLHDFYLKPWRECKGQLHGFRHGKIASDNAFTFFPDKVNDKVKDSIKKHMFPLTLFPPKFFEGWIVTLADKYVSLEVLSKPKELPRYIGLSSLKVTNYPKNVYYKAKAFFQNI